LSAAEDQIGIDRNHRRRHFLSNPIKRAYPLKPLCTPLNMVQAWFASVFIEINDLLFSSDHSVLNPI
jgi:hypothetical protein